MNRIEGLKKLLDEKLTELGRERNAIDEKERQLKEHFERMVEAEKSFLVEEAKLKMLLPEVSFAPFDQIYLADVTDTPLKQEAKQFFCESEYGFYYSPNPNDYIQVGVLYSLYLEWCAHQGIDPPRLGTASSLSRYLRSEFRLRRKGQIFYKNLAMHNPPLVLPLPRLPQKKRRISDSPSPPPSSPINLLSEDSSNQDNDPDRQLFVAFVDDYKECGGQASYVFLKRHVVFVRLLFHKFGCGIFQNWLDLFHVALETEDFPKIYFMNSPPHTVAACWLCGAIVSPRAQLSMSDANRFDLQGQRNFLDAKCAARIEKVIQVLHGLVEISHQDFIKAFE